MIGYVCKYTPINIIESFGEKTLRIEPSISNFNNADTLMHPNMCTYAKSVLEECINCNIDKIVLVNCCDSIRRLYDVLLTQKQLKYLYIIDIPRKNDCCAKELFSRELLKFINSLEKFLNKKFDEKAFENTFKVHNIEDNPTIKNSKNNFQNNVNIAIMGARCKKTLIDKIQNAGGKISFDFTCTSNTNKHNFALPSNINNIIDWYSSELLESFPCMRISDISKRFQILNENKNSIDGIIYHTVKFCDLYSYEYASLKNKVSIPMLKIETDYSEQSEGQVKTRLEAFIETLTQNTNQNKSLTLKHIDKNYLCYSKDKLKNKVIVIGIDSGSTSTNAVILDENSNILSYSIVNTGAKSMDGAISALNEALNMAKISKEDISYIISTGYGRVSIPFANENVTEITCHGKAAFYLNKAVRTIIDIGGQDSKVIRLDDVGNIKDFAMNDKCAAGTGRFLDMMAKTLEISIDKMGVESLKWNEDLSITNMCTVFAESEVVSLIAKNKEKADIIHGLNNSIASKTVSLINRLGKSPQYMMTGGVAKNIGVVKCIEEKLNAKIFIAKEPQIVGALGAALIALEKVLK